MDSLNFKPTMRKFFFGMGVAILLTILGCYIVMHIGSNSVGSSTQITQQNFTPVSTEGFVEQMEVKDTFLIRYDSVKAFIVYRDTSSNKILYTDGLVRNKQFYSKAAGSLAQTLPSYYNSDKQLMPPAIVITYSKR